MVKKLIEYNADIYAKGKDGSTPFYIAVQEGNASVVEYLLKKGCKDYINEKWSNGFTPLYIAGVEDISVCGLNTLCSTERTLPHCTITN